MGGCVRTPLCPQGRTHPHMSDPDPRELLRLIFSALSFVSAPKTGPTPQSV